MNKTLIEWVKNPDGTQGYTWNPITGCLNGCSYCYARKLANGRLKSRYLANHNYVGQDTGYGLDDVNNLAGIIDPCDDPFYPRLWEDRFEDIPSVRMMRGLPFKPDRRGIFVCDMSDLFGIGIPEDWTRLVLSFIEDFPEHRFYLLTKQPQNLPQWSPFPDNCWVGVTLNNQADADERIPELLKVEAKLRYLSIEPCQGAIDLTSYGWLWGCNACCNGDRCDNPRHYFRPQCPVCKGTAKGRNIDWVIIGSQTKPYKPPRKIWVDEIIEACKRVDIPYFLKDNLRPLMGNDLVQDMPRGVEIDH